MLEAVYRLYYLYPKCNHFLSCVIVCSQIFYYCHGEIYESRNKTVWLAHGNFYLFSYHLPCLFFFFHHRFVNNYFSIFIFIICAPFCRFFLLPPTCIQTQNTILLKLIYVSVFSPRYHSLIINTTIFNLVHFWHQTKIHQFF